MFFDFFLFLLSFLVMVCEKDIDFNVSARSWLWYFNTLFLIDLFFRLLSNKIEYIKREYWNDIIPYMFTICIWLYTAYLKFDNVFGSKPVEGLNIFLMIIYHIFLILYFVFNNLNQTGP